MALVLNDRVRETTTIVGTGTATLLGAAAGYQSFSVIGNANTCYYTISDQAGTNWEVGIGTYVSATPALARTTVLKSSNSNNLVSFPAGTKDVFVTYPAETSVSGGGGGTYPTVQPTLNLDFANTKLLDPRITFVRNSTAAYYDGQTTAMAEQNLLLQSQTFATTWVTSNTTLGSVTTAPDGTTTAYPLTSSAINGALLQTFTATATAYTFSIYIQRVTGTGNIDITVDGTTYATQTTSGTWTRFNITTTPSAGSKTAGIRLAVSGDVVNIWGAQLEQRSSATAYTPTTTAAITNYIPVLMTAPAGVARFDCDPITGKSLGLLIEESRTNLLTYSSDFSNAVWVLDSGALKTPNTIIAPDGSLTGCKLYSDATTAIHTLRQQVTTTAISYAYYIYAKAGEKRRIVLRDNTIGREGVFDLISGVVISSTGGFGSISSVGNGWYRCSIVGTLAAAGTRLQIVVAGDTATSYATSAFLGDGYSGIYIWGAQLEAGSFATSYIPTVASTVTRAADQASMTGTNFSSWYNVPQGAFYIDYDVLSIDSTTRWVMSVGVDPQASASFIDVYLTATSTITTLRTRYYATSSPAVINCNLTASIAASTNFKTAFAHSSGLQVSSTNGASINSNLVEQAPTNILARLNIGFTYTAPVNQLNGHIRKISYYPVALSSNNLVALTS